MSFELKTPVIFCIFARMDTTVRVFERIREAKPEKLYIVADAARENVEGEAERAAAVREYVESHIDWPCTVIKYYADKNMGCGKRISSGISQVFESEDRAIILEDDCVPDISFFRYCQDMLEYYRDNEEVFLISGNNPVASKYDIKGDYTFSKFPLIWGWATWARAWKEYDIRLLRWPSERKNPVWKKLFTRNAYWFITAQLDELYQSKYDTWDYQLIFAVVMNDRLCIVPSKNLVLNVGFGDGSSHTAESAPEWMTCESGSMSFPLKYEKDIERDIEFDRTYMEYSYRSGWIVHIKKLLGLNINKRIFEK